MSSVRVNLIEALPHGIGITFAGSKEEILLEAYGVVYQREHSRTVIPWHLIKTVTVENDR